MVERENAELSLATQADLLGISRSSLYYVPVPPSPEELYIKCRIDEIYTAHPLYGSRKILAVLRREMTINRKAVQRHMREMGLAAIYPGPNLSTPSRGRVTGNELSSTLFSPICCAEWRSRSQIRSGESTSPISASAAAGCPAPDRLDGVPRGCAGLVLPLRGQLGARPDAGNAIRVARSRAGAGSGHADDLEQRPGQPLH